MNALANFCFQTKQTNLDIGDRLPEEYFPEFEKQHPGALASQWIPTDPELWKIKNYPLFSKPGGSCWPSKRISAWRNCCTATSAGWRARRKPWRRLYP